MLHLTVNDLSNLKLEPYNIKYTSYRTNIENETLYFRFSATIMSITQLDKNNRKSCVIELDNISYVDIDDFFQCGCDDFTVYKYMSFFRQFSYNFVGV